MRPWRSIVYRCTYIVNVRQDGTVNPDPGPCWRVPALVSGRYDPSCMKTKSGVATDRTAQGHALSSIACVRKSTEPHPNRLSSDQIRRESQAYECHGTIQNRPSSPNEAFTQIRHAIAKICRHPYSTLKKCRAESGVSQ
jgi:hypothetical protein